MKNLNLHDTNGAIVHSIFRGEGAEIGIVLDYVPITSKFITILASRGWLSKEPDNKEEVSDLYFIENMAECAYWLWGYLFKKEIRKVS